MTRDELLRAWVDALESGQYKQAVGRLRSGDRYCCLGVLCELSGHGTWLAGEYEGPNGDLYESMPPVAVLVKADLRRDPSNDLARANDHGESFAQIAQRIRKMFPDVFPVAA